MVPFAAPKVDIATDSGINQAKGPKMIILIDVNSYKDNSLAQIFGPHSYMVLVCTFKYFSWVEARDDTLLTQSEIL